jgi:hypothetical protein
MDEFEIMITSRDWMNGPDRGTLLLMGITQPRLIAAVRRLHPDDYKMELSEREVRTGGVDKFDKPITTTKRTIKWLCMRRSKVGGWVNELKGEVDHHILRECRHRRYEADRLSEDLDDKYYGVSSCEVRSFVKNAKLFAYKLSKIPVAARRKEAVRSINKAFGKIIFDNTHEDGVMPTDQDEEFLMYSVYRGIKNLVGGDCFVTKVFHTLMFSEDTSVEFRIDPTTLFLSYHSRRAKHVVAIPLSEDLQAEIIKLRRIRGKQSTSMVFINPNSKTKMTYNALTKWAARYNARSIRKRG